MCHLHEYGGPISSGLHIVQCCVTYTCMNLLYIIMCKYNNIYIYIYIQFLHTVFIPLFKYAPIPIQMHPPKNKILHMAHDHLNHIEVRSVFHCWAPHKNWTVLWSDSTQSISIHAGWSIGSPGGTCNTISTHCQLNSFEPASMKLESKCKIFCQENAYANVVHKVLIKKNILKSSCMSWK